MLNESTNLNVFVENIFNSRNSSFSLLFSLVILVSAKINSSFGERHILHLGIFQERFSQVETVFLKFPYIPKFHCIIGCFTVEFSIIFSKNYGCYFR